MHRPLFDAKRKGSTTLKFNKEPDALEPIVAGTSTAASPNQTVSCAVLTKGGKRWWGVCDACQRSLVNDKFQDGVANKLRALAKEDPTLLYSPPYGILCGQCSASPDDARRYQRAVRNVAAHFGIKPMEVGE